MNTTELRQRIESIRLRAEAAQDLGTEELLDSFSETLDRLTGPQKRSARTLAEMTDWLERIEKGLAVAV